MANSSIASVTRSSSPLPPLPTKDPLTAEQWGILSAIADTIIPPLTACQGNRLLQHPLRFEIYEQTTKRIQRLAGVESSDGLVASYLGESATANPAFKDSISRLLSQYMDGRTRDGLIFVLNALK